MSVHKYATPHAVETILSTELNSLASAGVAVSGAVDNTTDLYKFADFEIQSPTGASTEGCYHVLYLLESEDGTNFEDTAKVTYSFGSHSGTGYGMVAQLIGTVRLVNGGGAIRKMLRHIHLPPTKFEVAFINGAGVSLAPSGNTVRLIRYNEQDA